MQRNQKVLCNQENDGHVCDKDEGHRGWHRDTREWSPKSGGALYEWTPNKATPFKTVKIQKAT